MRAAALRASQLLSRGDMSVRIDAGRRIHDVHGSPALLTGRRPGGSPTRESPTKPRPLEVINPPRARARPTARSCSCAHAGPAPAWCRTRCAAAARRPSSCTAPQADTQPPTPAPAGACRRHQHGAAPRAQLAGVGLPPIGGVPAVRGALPSAWSHTHRSLGPAVLHGAGAAREGASRARGCFSLRRAAGGRRAAAS